MYGPYDPTRMKTDHGLGASCEGQAPTASDATGPAPASRTARPLRVLQIITRLNIGGPARHTLTTARELRALGVVPLVVFGAADAHEGTFEGGPEAEGCEAVRIAALGRPVRPWHDMIALARLTRLVFAERPDVVHTHTAKAGVLGRLAAFAYNLTRRDHSRCVVVHTFHGHIFTGYFGATGSRLVQLVERVMAGVTDRILTVSPRLLNDICVHFRVAHAERAEVLEIDAGLEPLLHLEGRSPLRGELGFAPHHVVFGYVGRFVPIKNLPTLLRAFGRLSARCDHVRLLLVGDGELRRSMERLAAELGLNGRVHFTGWVRDLPAIYGALDVAVLTSINEGTPLVLLEAMAAGRPVIATAVGGVEDLIDGGRTGLLVAAGDEDALVTAMARVAASPDERERLGQAARRAIADARGRHTTAARLAALYHSLLEERRV